MAKAMITDIPLEEGGSQASPLLAQYRLMKRVVPKDVILLFRIGDFYDCVAEDAEVASPILGATLTTRDGHYACGFPYHAIDTYLARLVRAGMKAAIVEKAKDVRRGETAHRYEITRLFTHGTKD